MLSSPLKFVAKIAPKIANGTAKTTAIGSSHFSYSAAKIKNKKIIPNIKA